MKIIRYQDAAGKVHLAAEQSGGSYRRIEGELFGKYKVTREKAKIKKILAPVTPGMIWCIGQNYRQHAKEVGMGVPEYPVVFAKGANAVQHPGEPIVLPAGAKSTEVDYEAELVVVIGKKCKDVPKEKALDYVAGYTCGNDVS